MTIASKLISRSDITPAQMEAIEKMKARFKNEIDQAMYDDIWFFYRFLKARDFNLNQAEIMIKKHIQWRKSKNLDTFLDDFKPVEILPMCMALNQFAFDKEGATCFYMPTGKYDVKGIHLAARPSDIDNYILHTLESSEKLTKERYKNKKECLLPGCVMIYDLKDLTFSVATDKNGIDDFIRTARCIQDNYPERLKCVLVINAPSIFTITFSILKKFLAPNVVKKIHVYGTDGWKEHLLKLIDADQLPAFLGGNKTDPDGDPSCKSFINFSSPVPECSYLKKRKGSICRDPMTRRLVLPRASLTEINLNVSVPGSIIEWEFDTKSKDIAFGLFFKEKGEKDVKVTELVPLMRLDTEACTQTGVYKCEIPGTYTILFDNSYSWFRSKEVYYKATVVSPIDHEAQFQHQTKQSC